MTRETSVCPKCGGPMRQGYIATRRDRFSSVEADWIEGEAADSFWIGQYGVKAKSGLPVTALRCQSCGYLESYAREA
jgi:predicted nucleic-acid-binding Zn-ribbon protein